MIAFYTHDRYYSLFNFDSNLSFACDCTHAQFDCLNWCVDNTKWLSAWMLGNKKRNYRLYPHWNECARSVHLLAFTPRHRDIAAKRLYKFKVQNKPIITGHVHSSLHACRSAAAAAAAATINRTDKNIYDYSPYENALDKHKKKVFEPKAIYNTKKYPLVIFFFIPFYGNNIVNNNKYACK